MNSEPKRILIVEDDAGLALLFGEHLRRLGCRCDTVASAQACIAWLARNTADLMVLDYSLPDLLAPALVAELRKNGRLPAFVVVTGQGDERVAVELMKLGARDYLVKDHQVFDRLPAVVQRSLQEVEKERRLVATELALLAEKERLRRAELVGGFGHWELDMGKGVIRGSEGAKRIYGLEGEEWPIAVPQGCVLPEYRPTLDAQFQQLLAGEGAYDVEYEIRRVPDGLILAVHSTATFDPVTQTVFGIIQDISERRRNEVALRESEERLRVTLEITQIGVWDWDLAKDCWFASSTFFTMSGYEPEAGPANRAVWIKRLHPEDQAAVAAKIAAVLAGSAEDYEYEARMRHADGSYRWHQVRGHAVNRDSSGRPLRLVGIRMDITERRQVEEALRESLHEKEALLKEVHHRVKNNLQVISSLLRLQAGQSKSAGTREVLRDMQNRIRSMALLHETLYRSGNLARVDLADYLENVCTQLLRSTVQPEAGTIRLQFDLASVKVVATQAVPCGLLVNELVSNCLKHAFPEGRTGVVRVSLRPEDGGPRFRLQVADDGVGLPEGFAVAKLPSLGLQLVSDLSQQLDGALTIGPGPGARFVVTFIPKLPALPDHP